MHCILSHNLPLFNHFMGFDAHFERSELHRLHRTRRAAQDMGRKIKRAQDMGCASWWGDVGGLCGCGRKWGPRTASSRALYARLPDTSWMVEGCGPNVRVRLACPASGRTTPNTALRTRVRCEIFLADVRAVNVRVDLSRRDVGVAEHLLDSSQIGPTLEEMSRERMA